MVAEKSDRRWGVSASDYLLHWGMAKNNRVPGILKPYYQVASELSVVDGLLPRGFQIVIPSSLCLEVLDQIHAGHQGIHKCRQWASQSVWWPRLSKQLEELVKKCRECCKYQNQRAEPLIPSKIPELPWQKVGSDLFEWNKSTYLLIVDYYSHYRVGQTVKYHSKWRYSPHKINICKICKTRVTRTSNLR